MSRALRAVFSSASFASALAVIGLAGGCNIDDGSMSQLKCDASGCLVCEKTTCKEYQCNTSFQCPVGYGCTATGKCLPEASGGGGGATTGDGSGDAGTTDNTGAAQCASVLCPEGFTCEYGECIDPTTGTGTPTTECTLSAQCSDGKDCIDGACATRPGPTDEPKTCQSEADCAAGLTCAAGSCVDKGLPVRPEGTCQFNLDCGKSGTCVNSRCYFPPKVGTCPIGSVLEHGLCLPRTTPANDCQLSADCPASSICINATCRATCSADADCSTGNLCGKDGLCRLDDRPVLQCLVSGDCAEGQCVDGRCLSACDTAAANACVDTASQCAYGFCMRTTSCFVKADCSGTFDCVDGRCGTLGGAAAPADPPPADPPPADPAGGADSSGDAPPPADPGAR
jgi:hypothetical protein